MKMIEPGHIYDLENMEFPNTHQRISFIKKSDDGSGVLQTDHDGTTNEEVLKVLIERVSYLNHKLPCKENEIALKALREAFAVLNARTKIRRQQNVEGTNQPHY